MENSESIVERVKNLSANGIHAGTAVTREILDRLGSPDESLKIIHIAGTNGKGSTAEYITQILIAAGKRVGTFQSPAAYDYFEQFRINGTPIKSVVLDKYFGEALTAADGLDATEFEVETAGVIYAFKEEGCEYAVLECGMGGRDDATNAVNKKEVAIIASISLEHTAYLGNTLKEICENKAAIIKGCPAVVNALQSEEVLNYFKERGAVIAIPDIVTDKRYKLQMSGECQRFNAACAIEAARLLKIDETSIYMGVNSASLPARVQFFKAKNITFILDGAHNPASFAPLAGVLKAEKGVKCVIFGCLADKDVDGNVRALSGVADKIIAVKPDSPRAMDIEKITAACRKYFENVTKEESVESALCAASANSDIIAVCGSFTILKEAKQWIEKRS